MWLPHLCALFTKNHTRTSLSDMYRELLKLLLSFSLIMAAPQQNSNITYIKKQLDPIESQPEKHSFRESRIEILPLTIPGNFNLSEPANDVNETAKLETKQPEKPKNDEPFFNYSDRIYSIKSKPKKSNNTERTTGKPTEKNTGKPTEIPTEKTTEKPTAKTTERSIARTTSLEKSVDVINNESISDILPLESVNRHVLTNNDISTAKYETDITEKDNLASEKYEEEQTVIAEVVEETTKTPKFQPKLSHYKKTPTQSFSQNLIKNSNKRRFRSRCRCEKIWNCAKLQITVPRCPDEYFLCCA